MRIVTSLLVGLTVVGLSTQVSVAQQATLEEVKSRGTFVAGVRKDIPGFGSVNEAGEIVGFEIDLAREIATRLGVEVELVPVTAATRVALLEQRRVDALVASLSHYRSRDEVIDYTVSYFFDPQSLLVKRDGGPRSLSDMKGKRLGADIGSGTVQLIQEKYPEIKVQTFEGWPEAFLALQRGLVDAVGTDVLVLAGLRSKSPNPDEFIILGSEGEFANSYYGIGLRENESKWRDQLNYTLQDIWADGTWETLYEKWLGAKSEINLPRETIDFQMEYWRQ